MTTKEITKEITKEVLEAQKETEKCPYCGGIVELVTLGYTFQSAIEEWIIYTQKRVYYCSRCGRIIFLP